MSTYVRQQEITHAIGATGRLQIKVTDGDVRLRAADGDEVRLRATLEIDADSEAQADRMFADAMLEVLPAPGSLTVRDRTERGELGATLRRLISGRGHRNLVLDGEVPRACELRLEGVSAEVSVDGLRGDQVYAAVSGDLYLAAAGGSVRINTVSGDVTLRAEAPLALRADTVSGDLSAMAPRLDSLRLNTVSGDLEIEGELDARGDFRAESVSGDFVLGLVGNATVEVRGISSDVVAQVDHRLEGRSDRRRVVIGSGQPELVFSSMSGDVMIRRPRHIEARPPAPPAPPPPATPPSEAERAAEAASLEILRALERGEIDVDEAARRLAEGRSDA